MANIAIFRINYKSDFILTLNSDAGWMTPFCIKFWTGAPSQAYFVGYDGTTYTHCAPVDGEPTKLRVQFDDHHLPIGDLKFQIGYHFTVDDFPTNMEDEVLNQASVIIEQDGEPAQVMLDFTGETAPEIQFSLPAYANEAQRIANEEQRIAHEAIRIVNEESRIAAETIRQQNEAQRISNEESRVAEFARLKQESETATADANAAATLANEKAQLAADKAALAGAAATLANAKAQLAADKAALADAAATLANAKAALAQQKADYAQTQGDYAKAHGDYAKAQGEIAEEDHDRAEADHTRAESDHATAGSDHTQAGTDHTRAESDHATAAADHTQAGQDHTRAESDHSRAESDHTTAAADHTQAGQDHTTAASDHTQAGSDHTRAESDHTRAESDHAAVEVYVDSLGAFDISAYHATGGVLAEYADLAAALGTNGANIPDALRKGGMSVKFVQSSDHKYIQARCMAQSFTTDVTQWQGVDDVPTAGSENLVKSDGVANAINAVSDSLKVKESVGEMYYTKGTISNGNLDISSKDCLATGFISVLPSRKLNFVRANDISIRITEYGSNKAYLRNTGTYGKFNSLVIGNDTYYIRISAYYAERGYSASNPISVSAFQAGDFGFYEPVVGKVDSKPLYKSRNFVDSKGIFSEFEKTSARINNIVGSGEIVINLSEYPVNDFIIEGGDTWIYHINQDYQSIIIPVYQYIGGTLTIVGNQTNITYVALLSNDNFGINKPVSFGSGWSAPVSISANSTKVFDISSNCNYLYVLSKGNTDRTPQSVVAKKDATFDARALPYSNDIVQGNNVAESLDILNDNAEIVYSNIKTHKGWIDTNSYVNTNNDNRLHKAVKIIGGSRIVIKATNSAPLFVVKSYTPPTSDVSPDFATGETERRMTGTTEYEFTAPLDAKYLVIGYKYDNLICNIEHLIVDGYDFALSHTENYKKLLVNKPASDISYDGTKLSVNNVKEGIDVLCDDGDFVSYNNIKPAVGFLTDSTFEYSSTRTHKVVKIRGNSLIKIRSRLATGLAVVKTYSIPTGTDTIDFATGETGRRFTVEGKMYCFVAPADANYLIINYKYDNVVYDIYELDVDGHDLMQSVIHSSPAKFKGMLYEGERIDTNNRYYLKNMPFISNGVYHQSLAIYEETMFIAGNKTQNQEIPLYIVDMKASAINSTIQLPYTTVMPHCSGLCFSRDFYDNNIIPLLYVSVNNVADGRGCIVYNVSESNEQWNCSIVQTINVNIDNGLFGAGDNIWVVDYDNKHLYSIAYKKNEPYYTNNNNSCVVCKFNLPSTGSSVVTLTGEDILDSYEVEHFTYFQDACYIGGKIYVACGGGSSYLSTNVLYVIDLIKRKVVSKVKYPQIDYEIEGLDLFYRELVMYGNTMVGKRFVFL